jgi:PDZ domain
MHRSLITLLLGVLVAFGLTLFNQYIGAFIALPHSESFLGHLCSLFYLGVLLYTLMVAARAAAELPYRTTTLFAIAFPLLLPLATTFFLKSRGDVATPLLALTASNLFAPPAALLVGAGIGRIIKHPNTLVAASAIALFFDIVVVTMGTVAALQKSGNASIISTVSLNTNTSLQGTQAKTHAILSGVTIGPADVLFLAFFFAAIYCLGNGLKHKEQPALFPEMQDAARETFPWVFGFLLFALAIVEFFYLPIPALAPMGIAVIVANAKYKRFTQQEKRDSLIASVFAVACAVFIVWGAQKYIPAAKPDYGIQEVQRVPKDGRLIIMTLAPDSLALKSGLKGGDVIDSINGQDLRKIPQDRQSMEASQKKIDALLATPDGLTLEVERPGWDKPRTFQLKQPKS